MKMKIENKHDTFGKWFWKKYMLCTLLGIILFVAILSGVYCLFAFTSFIPAGKNLHRTDWLSFLGGIFTLIGSLVVSVISITQAAYFNEREQERQRNKRVEDRYIEIKPELVIVINGRNVRIPYIDRWPSERLHMAMFGEKLPNQYSGKYEAESKETAILRAINTTIAKKDYTLDNIWISIVNVGKHSVKHIEVYDEYYFPFIRPGESIDIILTLDEYPRKTSAFSSDKGIDVINESISRVKIIDVRKEMIDAEGCHVDEPKQYDYIWMNYEDVDGNSYQQKFRMHPSSVGNYFCSDEAKRMLKTNCGDDNK